MKKLTPTIAAALLASSLAGWSATTIFTDTFGSSTTNQTSIPGGTPAASFTSYDIASTKDGRTCTIGGNQLRMKLGSATSAGYIEVQAIFASTPVQLANVGDSINLTFTFTNSAGTLLKGGDKSQIDVGLFNSGGTLPLAGNLVNAGLGSATTYISGNCQNWEGYVGKINYNGTASSIYTRPKQVDFSVNAANNGVQDLLFSGAGTGLYKFPSGTTVGSTMTSTVTLSTGGTYTRSFTIARSGGAEVTITDELYSGSLASGVPLSSMVRTTSGGTTYTNFSNQFDALAIGIANNGTNGQVGGYNPQMDISKITVTKSSASENALYNVQLNGYTNTTFSGAAQTGSSGDLWNNPDWAGVYTGSTNILTGVTVLDSEGANYGVTLTMTSKFNNNTGDWNTGSFNHYTGQTAGSATAALMDQLAKIDYNAGLGGINDMKLTFSGLPTNTFITAYVYGAGNGSGQGSKWGLDAANGGGSAVISYDGSATGRNVTLANNEGICWEVLTGASDSAGNFVVTNTGPGSGTWWQIYMNGIQLKVGGTAPAIFGLTNQTVEAGSTVNLNPVVDGNPTPTYQWRENGVDMPGKTNSSLTLPNVSISQSNYVYSLVAVNPLGSVTNSMTLTVFEPVYSAMTVTAVSPANNATGICYDTPLTVTFSDSVKLGTIGSIKIYNATNSTTPVDTIDASLGYIQQRTFPGDGQSFSYLTIKTNGNTVTIYPHFNVMTSNQTYYVTIDPKTFKDSGGVNFIGLTDTNAWRFSTKGGPADATNLVVNANGTGDYLTVQGAVNGIPSGNTTPRVINVRNGDYNEIINISGKHNVTFRGQSRAGTLVGFANNNTFQSPSSTTHNRMTFKVNANDIALENLTVTNRTPQGGSQAEALMIETGAARCIVNSCDIVSRQDTILANVNSSQCYFYRSLIIGNFDYIWGGGNLYFDQCEIRTISGAAGFNVTAARTSTNSFNATYYPWANPGGTYTANGMSFVNCAFTASSGVTTITLAGSNGTAGNNVSWFGCTFATNYVAPSVLFSGNYLFWQAENTQNSAPVTFANITTHAGTDAEMLAATNIPVWFYGWSPALAPNIVTNPASQSATTGLPAVFTVSATGLPAPTYQWKHAGTNLAGEVGSSLTIASVQSSDAGDYEVEVSNASGTVTSTTATLTVLPPNTAPVFGSNIGSTNINVGVSLSVANTATDSDSPAQTLTYSLLAGPSGAAVDSGTGNFTWRPTTAQADTTNTVSVVVTDNGTPNLNATNTFTVRVNPLPAPTTGAPSYAGGLFSVSVNGQVGPDYLLQATTNLASPVWITVATTNSPATMPVLLTDPNAGTQPSQFYRILVGP